MDKILSIKQAALELYGNDKKSTRVTLARQCATGVIKNAEKCGDRWFINATREWPNLFGEIDPASVMPGAKGGAPAPSPLDGVTAETTIGELFAKLAQTAAVQG